MHAISGKNSNADIKDEPIADVARCPADPNEVDEATDLNEQAHEVGWKVHDAIQQLSGDAMDYGDEKTSSSQTKALARACTPGCASLSMTLVSPKVLKENDISFVLDPVSVLQQCVHMEGFSG